MRNDLTGRRLKCDRWEEKTDVGGKRFNALQNDVIEEIGVKKKKKGVEIHVNGVRGKDGEMRQAN